MNEGLPEWQTLCFNHIIQNPTGTYLLVIPRRCGKSHLLVQLQKHFQSQGARVKVYTITLPGSLRNITFGPYPPTFDPCDVLLIYKVDLIHLTHEGHKPTLIIKTSSTDDCVKNEPKSTIVFEYPSPY